MRKHNRVMRRQCLELVRRGDEWEASQRRDVLGDQLGDARLGTETGADRRSALRQRIKLLERSFVSRLSDFTCAA